MKKVISGNKLKETMIEAVNLISGAVGSSLGPLGSNVLIDTDEMSSFITNDGVTIARYISSDNKEINSILDIIKEASLKTDEMVGDGTTTTLVLTESIYKEGLKEIEKGIPAIMLKKEFDCELDNIILKINSLKRKPTNRDLLSIGTISANDENISKVINEVYSKMKNKNSIIIEQSNTDKTYYKIDKGYSIDTELSYLYFKIYKEIILNNAYILLIRGYLDDLECISAIINECIDNEKSIVIIADEIDESIKKEVLIYNLKENKNIYMVELPSYDKLQESIMDDLSFVSNGNIKNIDYEKVYFEDLGCVQKCVLKKDEIIFVSDNDVSDQVKKLKTELDNTDECYEKENLNNRISKLENGIATIYVGGITETEKKEKKMRYIDALSSISIATEGVVVGEGITFHIISETIKNGVLKRALKEPLKKIFSNAGIDIQEIESNKVYNFDTNKLEDISTTNIIDPANVLIESIKNAVSIAGMLLTTNYLVINESYEKTTEL